MKQKLKKILAGGLGLLMLLSVAAIEAQAAPAVRKGDTGSTVKEIQQKLSQWGYYDGEIDGIFGSGTEKAVKDFQRKQGLTADGVVGTQTAAKMGISLGNAAPSGTSGTLGRGDAGSAVKQVQQALKEAGYDPGEIDGVFGSATEAAVRKFQKANGLTADGVVGAQTAGKLGVSIPANAGTSTSGVSQKDVMLMARCIYGEARGESYRGKVAVGAVILNRVKSAQFPNTVAGVIYQPRAFSAVTDGQINLQPDAECIRAARDALNGVDPTGNCVYYYNPDTATDPWIRTRRIVTRIGRHVFCV